jgi:hypothetical protein
MGLEKFGGIDNDHDRCGCIPTFLELMRQAMAGGPEGDNPEDMAGLFLNCFIIVSVKVR